MKKNFLDLDNIKWQTVLYNATQRKSLSNAIAYLDKILVHHAPLFEDEPTFKELRKEVLFIRIELFRKYKRDVDTLASLCLLSELDPKNNLAKLLLDQYKNKLGLQTFDEEQNKLFNEVQVSDDVAWGDIKGMFELKTKIKDLVIKPIKYPKLYQAYKIYPPNGILFYGPSGCGKTYIARQLAKTIDYGFMEIVPSDLSSIYVHGTQEKISKVFKNAIDKAPTILFFDEFDAMVPNRDNASQSISSEVNEFLVQLNNISEKNVIVIAATNKLKNVDKAILRPGRFDEKIFISPPDLSARIDTMKFYLRNIPCGKINWQQIGEYTDYFTFSELRHLIKTAVRNVVDDGGKVLNDHLINAIQNIKPEFNEEIIKKMKDF
ncbi:MAG: hypothetical protein AMXMBFR48_22560 [Ignavibacteriales bacterium]